MRSRIAPQFKPGTDLYSIATGMIDITRSSSQVAAEYIPSCEGFIAAHITTKGVLWLFDSLNNAKIARNKCEGEGMTVGKNIALFTADEKGQLFGRGDPDNPDPMPVRGQKVYTTSAAGGFYSTYNME
jgi:hypothetical protein